MDNLIVVFFSFISFQSMYSSSLFLCIVMGVGDIMVGWLERLFFWLIGLSNALLLQWLTVKLSFTIW